MPIIATKSEYPQRALPPTGNHIARCYKMIEIGTVKETIKNEVEFKHKVRIGWELPLETHVFDEKRGPEPFVVEKEYTLSMGEKSNLRRDLKSWRGQDFTDKEAEAFDITVLLGVPCMINIGHKATQKDPSKFYEEILGITPLPKGTACPAPVNPKMVFELSNFNQALFDSLPEFIKDKIRSSQEYQLMQMPDAPDMPIEDEMLKDRPF